ncbi:MAG: response regulator [Magnetospirillum sp.]|nr:response regulator [Magnetospirillum sp.]
MSVSGAADNENERRIVEEFLEEVRDTVNGMSVLVGNLRSKAVGTAEGLEALRRETHNLRSQSQGLAQPLIKLVTHRLDEYVCDLKEIGPAALDEIEIFIGKIEAFADGEAVSEDDIPGVVRSLPAKRTLIADFGNIEKKNVEIMLVVSEKAMARIVERELAACGYRTVTVRDPFEAMEMAVRTRPDMVVAAMELGVLSGVDLGCALAAMAATSGIPYAVLTSYDWGNPKLKGLPPRAAIIRKGAHFGDDLAETLNRFSIT